MALDDDPQAGRVVLDRDGHSVALGDDLDKMEPQSVACGRSHAATAMEALEKPQPFVSGNAGAGICDDETDAVGG